MSAGCEHFLPVDGLNLHVIRSAESCQCAFQLDSTNTPTNTQLIRLRHAWHRGLAKQVGRTSEICGNIWLT